MANLSGLLPIKVVFKREGDYLPAKGGGGSFDPLEPVTKRVRDKLSAQIRDVEATLAPAFETWRDLPGVARVKLKDAALAKTKRPTEVLNPATCPIIGCNKLGELYVSATPAGLSRLNTVIQTETSDTGTAHISTLERIEPFSTDDVVSADILAPMSREVARVGLQLRCRLFRHPDEATNAALDREFERYAAKCGVREVESLDYARGVKVLSLTGMTPPKIAMIKRFVGLQSLGKFPGYRIVRTMAHAIGNLTAKLFPAPVAGRAYPIVGMIDSGTDPTNVLLQQWVVGRLDVVPRNQQNNAHGSFVAGLLANAWTLNHKDPRFPNAPCKIVDVVAIDKDGEISRPVAK